LSALPRGFDAGDYRDHTARQPQVEKGAKRVSGLTGGRALAIAFAMACAVGTTHIAGAEPPSFPDLSGYVQETVADYVIAVSGSGTAPAATVYFRAPDNPEHPEGQRDIACEFISGSARCSWHDFPANPSADTNTVHWIATDSGQTMANVAIDTGLKVHGQSLKRLPPLHSLAFDGVICGVNEVRTIACKDPQGRGFTLTWHGVPNWLPHV
jgi:hypothetical protein